MQILVNTFYCYLNLDTKMHTSYLHVNDYMFNILKLRGNIKIPHSKMTKTCW